MPRISEIFTGCFLCDLPFFNWATGERKRSAKLSSVLFRSQFLARIFFKGWNTQTKSSVLCRIRHSSQIVGFNIFNYRVAILCTLTQGKYRLAPELANTGELPKPEDTGKVCSCPRAHSQSICIMVVITNRERAFLVVTPKL